jgi:hypothetical protein
MLELIKKFNQLPAEIKNKISNQIITAKIEELEKKYDLNLALLVMRLAVKDIDFKDLPKYLENEMKLTADKSSVLIDDLKKHIFADISQYLNIENKSEAPIYNNAIPAQKLKKGSDFYISSEDEEEIRGISKKIENYQPTQNSQINYEKIISEIIKELGIFFGSQEINGRFSQILSTYLKGIRNKIDTRNSLSKSYINGGVNLDDVIIDKIFNLIQIKKADNSYNKAVYQKIKLPDETEQKKEKVDFAKLETRARDIDYDFSKLKENNKFEKKVEDWEKIKSEPEKIELDHRLAPPPPVIIEKQLSKKIDNKPIVKKIFDEPKPATNESINKPKIQQFTKPNRVAPDYGKKRIQDVVAVPKIMSPIDELRYMDCVSFRRMGDSPAAIINKIKQKIAFLEEEKYSRRLEGIKAWRNSPVNKLYLQIGQDSISHNKPINAIIEERKRKGMDFLSQEELEAVIELNQSLRF